MHTHSLTHIHIQTQGLNLKWCWGAGEELKKIARVERGLASDTTPKHYFKCWWHWRRLLTNTGPWKGCYGSLGHGRPSRLSSSRSWFLAWGSLLAVVCPNDSRVSNISELRSTPSSDSGWRLASSSARALVGGYLRATWGVAHPSGSGSMSKMKVNGRVGGGAVLGLLTAGLDRDRHEKFLAEWALTCNESYLCWVCCSLCQICWWVSVPPTLLRLTSCRFKSVWGFL